MSMSPFSEDVGKAFFVALMKAGQELSMTDLLVLRSAWKGKLAWHELPDHLRQAFSRVAKVTAREVLERQPR